MEMHQKLEARNNKKDLSQIESGITQMSRELKIEKLKLTEKDHE